VTQAPIPGSGLRPRLAAELEALAEPALVAGRVLAQHSGQWLVALADETGWSARLLPARGRLRGTTPVTGDWVAVDAGGAIVAVLERSCLLERLASGEGMEAQALAANVDLVLVVEALPEADERRVERFVSLAAAASAPVALVLTKADLDPDADQVAAGLRRRLGLDEALAVSVRDGGAGLAALHSLLVPDATTALLGASGAGKSTLVNTLLGEERQATAPVRERDGRGRHTTVTRELIELPGGALLLDTPGLREVGLWAAAGGFEDVERLAASCRFGDCTHRQEPECAVREGVAPERLEAWHRLADERASLDARRRA
jgi:ribosome biogenesis GTPase